MSRTIGQIALAAFSNYEGLVDMGGNTYMAGPNSGLPVITAPMENGAGSLVGGALEAANVDISNEFINMIVASTGFSAASRVITTSNQLLTELLGLMALARAGEPAADGPGRRPGQGGRTDMITVTRLSKKPLVVNAELIKFVESTPDTMITLTTGDKIMVLETLDQIVDRAVAYGRRLRCFSADAAGGP